MRFIRFDSVGGASGDMILGTLIGLGIEPSYIERELSSLIPGEFHLHVCRRHSHGIEGIQVSVEIPGEAEGEIHSPEDERHHHRHSEHHDQTDRSSPHHHRTFAEIREMIGRSSLSTAVKRDAVAVFRALAEAEGTVHGKLPEEVSFHEVGAVDSIVDIVGAVIGLHSLGIEAISIGPIPVGSGTVRCAHGVYPVPAPAVAALIETFRLPISFDGEEYEMLTPTGAVLLGWWKKVSGAEIRSAHVLKSANALGKREFSDRPNLLRASLLETERIGAASSSEETVEDLLRFDANIDDVTGEILSRAADLLFQAGALDVWFSPIQMKKGRPAVMLSVLARPVQREMLLEIIFRQTGTFGVREVLLNRYALGRKYTQVKTSAGNVTVKTGIWRGEDIHFAPEFDDCAAAAQKADLPVRQIYRQAVAEYLAGRITSGEDGELEKEKN